MIGASIASVPLADGPQASVSYQVNPLLDLQWADWGEDSVAHDACSGQLFHFDALSAALFACFEQGCELESEALAQVRMDLGDAAGPDLVDLVATRVRDFVRIGWLEPKIA